VLSTDIAISRFRRDLTLGWLLKALLLVAALATPLLLPVFAPNVSGGLVMLVLAGIWLMLTYNSARKAQTAADVPALIAGGQYEEAEAQLEQSVRQFSLIRAVKLQTLHQLALLRHAQRRYRESAALCQELLGHRLGSASGLARPVRLLLADAMLELDDLSGVHEALTGMYGQRLTLAETLQLLSAQLDYEARIGAWPRMMHEVMTKVQLAELMPSSAAASTQALLALAARHTGRQDFCDWLAARAELLADPADLIARRPHLAELWHPTATP
jgi:hypothetical protein